MTKRQRAQVVELLRCAADYIARDGWDPGGALSMASSMVNHDGDWFSFAYRVERNVCADLGRSWPPNGKERIESLLEAAARVEEGSWP